MMDDETKLNLVAKQEMEDVARMLKGESFSQEEFDSDWEEFMKIKKRKQMS
jgi:hypothetical protein